MKGAGAVALPRIPSMEITLPTGFGLVDRIPVFMDIAEDSYFRLGPGEEQSFLAALKNFERQTGPIVQGLVRGFENEEWTVEPVFVPPPPKRTLPSPSNFRNPKLFEVLAAARLVLAIRQSLRTRSIADILDGLSAKFGRSNDVRDPISAALAFRNARRFIPLRGNCLSYSLALMHWLAAEGESASLVFGVKLDPFAAHCWVQSGDVLLNDRPERVERFARVRSIECTHATP